MSPWLLGLLKRITDEVYQLIWILVINWKNSGLTSIFYSKTFFLIKNSSLQVADINCLAYAKIDGFLVFREMINFSNTIYY